MWQMLCQRHAYTTSCYRRATPTMRTTHVRAAVTIQPILLVVTILAHDMGSVYDTIAGVAAATGCSSLSMVSGCYNCCHIRCLPVGSYVARLLGH
jgi:hypothetical protein